MAGGIKIRKIKDLENLSLPVTTIYPKVGKNYYTRYYNWVTVTDKYIIFYGTYFGMTGVHFVDKVSGARLKTFTESYLEYTTDCWKVSDTEYRICGTDEQKTQTTESKYRLHLSLYTINTSDWSINTLFDMDLPINNDSLIRCGYRKCGNYLYTSTFESFYPNNAYTAITVRIIFGKLDLNTFDFFPISDISHRTEKGDKINYFGEAGVMYCDGSITDHDTTLYSPYVSTLYEVCGYNGIVNISKDGTTTFTPISDSNYLYRPEPWETKSLSVSFGSDVYVYSITTTTGIENTIYYLTEDSIPQTININNPFDSTVTAPFWDTENERYLVLDSTGLYAIEYEQYNKTLTLGDYKGDTISTLTDLGTIDSIKTEYADGISTITVTSPQTGTKTLTYEVSTPAGYKLMGYSYAPNGVVQFPLGETINVDLTNGGAIYEVIGRDYSETGLKFTLYKNTAESNRVDKTSYLIKVTDVYGILREETSITSPSFNIEYSKVPDFNYIYIPKFSRYYFVTGITSVDNNLWRISCSVDVLMSYKSYILNLSAHVDRNEQFCDPMIPDTERVVSGGQEVYESAFILPADRPQIVMSPTAATDRNAYCMVVNGYRLTVKELS